MKNLLSLLDKFYDIIAGSIGNEELFVLHWHRFKDLLQEEPLNYQKIYSYIAKINSENLNAGKPPMASIQRDTRLDNGDVSNPSLSRKNSVGAESFKHPSLLTKDNTGAFPNRGLGGIKPFSNEKSELVTDTFSTTIQQESLTDLSKNDSTSKMIKQAMPLPKINIASPSSLRNSGIETPITRVETEIESNSAVHQKDFVRTDRAVYEHPRKIEKQCERTFFVVPALDYVSKLLRKPYFTISNYAVYYNHYVLRTSDPQHSLYRSISLTYFLYLLSDKYPEKILEELVTRVVNNKIRIASAAFSQEQLYECVATTLKRLLQGRQTAKTEFDYFKLQEEFIEKFFGNPIFNEAMTLMMREFTLEYLCSLDADSFMELFPNESSAQRLITDIKNSHLDPSEDIVSILPHIVDASLEVHYIESSKIDIVLYGIRSEKSLFETRCHNPMSFTIVCAQQREGKYFYTTLPGEDMEPFTRFAEEPFRIDKSKLNFHRENPKSKTVLKDLAACNPTQEDSGKLPKNLLAANSTISMSENSDENSSKQSIPSQRTSLEGGKELKFDAQKFLQQTSRLMDLYEKHSEKLYPLVKKQEPVTNDNRARNLQNEAKVHLNVSKPSIFASNKNTSNEPMGTKLNELEPIGNFDEHNKNTEKLLSSPNSNKRKKDQNLPSQRNENLYGVNSTREQKLNGNTENFSNPAANHFLSPYYSFNAQKFESPKRKQNLNAEPVVTRSPLKRIDIYTHKPKESAFAMIEKEAALIDEMIKRSPTASPSTNRLILENN